MVFFEKTPTEALPATSALPEMEPVPVTGRSGPGLSVSTGQPILFFSLFFYIKYSKFLVNLNRISQRMHEDPLIEADYMNHDYLEAKSAPEHILDRPVRSSKIQTGSISGRVALIITPLVQTSSK